MEEVTFGTKISKIKPANPSRSGYVFTSWSAGDDDLVYGNMSVYAQYRPLNTYKLNVGITGNQYGSTNPAAGEHSYTEGTQVTITAIPNANGKFTGWSGAGTGTSTTRTITMTGDLSVTAIFEEKTEETETIKVNVKVIYPYEHPLSVSGNVYVKYGSTTVGSGSYSGTHMYGFSTTLSIVCTYPVGKRSSLTLSYANAYPNGWNPTLSFV